MRDLVSILPLRIEGLGFKADGKALLQDITLDIGRGGLTALIGPNGAGKSLLLRLCHGLIQPCAGRLNWAHGAGFREGRKRHAMVFQKPVMLRRSVRANMEHALRSAGLPRVAIDLRGAEALSRFGLDTLVDRPARVLSGGEQQRLAIARAWALEPDVLFLDEPCAHLDPGATGQIETILRGLVAEGVTLVMATHDLGQARRLADRVIFLNRGLLVETAEAGEFFAAPKTREARCFMDGELLW
jgi:tungstate transport system ATP-binding protein